jgi:nickel-type superoxide dismutase maturation protease
MVLKVIKVSGRSLYPVYQDGDYVIISIIPILFAWLHSGDRVVFDHPTYGRLIKRIEQIAQGGRHLFVVGENDDSVDSRRFGAIPRAWLKGKVIWHIAPRR